MQGEATIGDRLARHARDRGTAPAIVCDTLGTLTFGVLGGRLDALRTRLREAGLPPAELVEEARRTR